MATYTLQILHASDFEAGLDAVDRAGNFAAIVDYLEETHANSITLSSGDNYLPSPFFNAGSDASLKEIYETALEEPLQSRAGHAEHHARRRHRRHLDAQHHRDRGIRDRQPRVRRRHQPVRRHHPADGGLSRHPVPYLSANIDFAGDPNLNPLFTDIIQRRRELRPASRRRRRHRQQDRARDHHQRERRADRRRRRHDADRRKHLVDRRHRHDRRRCQRHAGARRHPAADHRRAGGAGHQQDHPGEPPPADRLRAGSWRRCCTASTSSSPAARTRCWPTARTSRAACAREIRPTGHYPIVTAERRRQDHADRQHRWRVFLCRPAGGRFRRQR